MEEKVLGQEPLGKAIRRRVEDKGLHGVGEVLEVLANTCYHAGVSADEEAKVKKDRALMQRARLYHTLEKMLGAIVTLMQVPESEHVS